MARDEYYELTYFVDKTYMGNVTTCSGKQLGCPKINTTFEECSQACDADVHNCRGFAYYPDRMCFLFSKFETLRVYVGCPRRDLHDEDRHAVCMGKFHDYNGANLSPNPSGKCPDCLKEFDVRMGAAKGCFNGATEAAVEMTTTSASTTTTTTTTTPVTTTTSTTTTTTSTTTTTT